MDAVGRTARPVNGLAGQFIRYALSGAVAMLVTLAIYATGWRLLARLGVPGDYLFADVAGWFGGMLVIYTLSCRWVFEQRRLAGRRGGELAMFILIGLVGLLWSQLGLWGLVGKLGVQRDLAKLIMAAVVFLWNFSVRRAVLFR